MVMEGKRFRVILFCFFLALYILTFRGVSVGDNVFHYEFTKSVLVRQQLSLPVSDQLLQTDRSFSPFFAIGRDERPYSTLPPGLVIASMPLGSIGFLIESISEGEPIQVDSVNTEPRFDIGAAIADIRDSPSGFMTGLINPIISALMLVVFFSFSARIGRDSPRAFILTMLLGCCTIVWPYSTTYWTQPLATFCLFSSLYFLYRFRESLNQIYLLVSGLLAGFAVLTRYELVLFLPLYLMYAVIAPRQRANGRLKAGLLFLSASIAVLILLLVWNSYRFGSVLDTGAAHQHDLGFSLKGDLARSIPANLIGLNRSLFIFSPPLILGLFGFSSLFRTRKALAWVILVLATSIILLYSKFSFWAAWGCWGPRFLVILTPFLLLPAATARTGRIMRYWLLPVLAAAGFLIQLAAVLIPFQRSSIEAYFGSYRVGKQLFRSEIIPQFMALFSEQTGLWWTTSLVTMLLGILLISVLILTGWCLMKAYTSVRKSSRIQDI
jgi:4-amino-4-deoxy-L-arabinose transferase-like glycosyltransferase